MPNSRTFNIKAISSIIEKYAHGGWHNDTIVTVERKIN